MDNSQSSLFPANRQSYLAQTNRLSLASNGTNQLLSTVTTSKQNTDEGITNSSPRRTLNLPADSFNTKVSPRQGLSNKVFQASYSYPLMTAQFGGANTVSNNLNLAYVPSRCCREEEIRRIRELKSQQVLSDKNVNTWKEKLQDQMEKEITMRVREALSTPPLERMKRVKDQALKRQAEKQAAHNAECLEKAKSNSSLASERTTNLTSGTNAPSTTEEFNSRLLADIKRQFKETTNKNQELPSMSDKYEALMTMSNNQFRYFLLCNKPLPLIDETDMIAGISIGYKRDRKSIITDDKNTQVLKTDNVETKCLDNGPTGSNYENSNVSKADLRYAMKIGHLPDGTQLTILPNGRYMDKFGIIRDKHGPFWPQDYNPICATPIHKRCSKPSTELLGEVETLAATSIHRVAPSNFTGNWRGTVIVFDNEKQIKPQDLDATFAPSLSFESRFECGNLRQARRIGQFTYELVLSTDMYTQRHTQWYYFRISNALPDHTYTFIIINFLKQASLYQNGMRPLLYSEQLTDTKNIGWYRVGRHVQYTRNTMHLSCPILFRDLTYYQLEWQMEFPCANDTYYLAHCYPYTFTDLKSDIDSWTIDLQKSHYITKDVLCETLAGNSCFALTISDRHTKRRSTVTFDDIDKSNINQSRLHQKHGKKGVLISARVHPGESNSSYMMKGIIEFLLSEDSVAQELRRCYVFKIIPMLNPDGVIVGNYRCSLAARDLNRNYRHPWKDIFPTVWHTKNLLTEFSKQYDVVLYCDLHGHSRKHNVFMYGNDSKFMIPDDLDDSGLNSADLSLPSVVNSESISNKKAAGLKATKPNISTSLNPEVFFKDRLFPFLLSKKAPEMFSFGGCRFDIRKSKESTGRVVMWRQLRVPNSFTMEAAFSGTVLTKNMSRHFNTFDLESMGRFFGGALLDFQKVSVDENKYSQLIVEMTKSLVIQIQQEMIRRQGPMSHLSLENQNTVRYQNKQFKISPGMTNNDGSLRVKTSSQINTIEGRSAPQQSTKLEKTSLLELPQMVTTDQVINNDKESLLSQLTDKLNDISSSQDCFTLFQNYNLANMTSQLGGDESDAAKSSDSDSESEAELPAKSTQPKGEKQKKKKRSKQKHGKGNAAHDARKKLTRTNSNPLLPSIDDKNKEDNIKSPGKRGDQDTKCTKQKLPLFVSKYKDRSNGGIPCFAEERLLERATKKFLGLQNCTFDDWDSFYEYAEMLRYNQRRKSEEIAEYLSKSDVRVGKMNDMRTKLKIASLHGIGVDTQHACSDGEYQDWKEGQDDHNNFDPYSGYLTTVKSNISCNVTEIKFGNHAPHPEPSFFANTKPLSIIPCSNNSNLYNPATKTTLTIPHNNNNSDVLTSSSKVTAFVDE